MCEPVRYECDPLQRQLDDLETRLRALEGKEKIQVAFSALAEYGGAHGNFCNDQTLIFNSVLTNVGHCYSSSTGVFVAPVAGVYYFSLFYHAGGERMARLKLMKNSNFIVMASDHQSGPDTADNGANAVHLQLEKGDQVYVQMVAGSHVWAGDHSTSFNGHLVCEKAKI
ncbi:complement C1q tumor necrosis factor-related protein 3-like [Symphorus nematophorus]